MRTVRAGRYYIVAATLVVLIPIGFGIGSAALFSRFQETNLRVEHARETARAQAETNRRICLKVDTLDGALIGIVQLSARPLKPGDYGYAYTQAHPEESRKRGGNVSGAVDALRRAACDPAHLPKVGP